MALKSQGDPACTQEMVQAIFLRQHATAGGKPAWNIFMNYARFFGGGETGDKEADRKSRFVDLDFEKFSSATTEPTIDITKKSSSNSA